MKLDQILIAECSFTYRKLFAEWLKPYAKHILDLWEEPSFFIDENRPLQLAIVDEAFLSKGPGPARSILLNLLADGRITRLPILILERREKQIPVRIHSRAFKLRRPFLSKELEGIFENLGIQPPFLEVIMEENVSEKIEQAIALSLSQEKLAQKTQEALEKAIREIVPAMAEKLIKEEIERLTR